MLTLIALFLFLFVLLAVVLGGGALVIQGYLYSEPAAKLYAKGPAAAAAMTAFLAAWAFLDYRGLDVQRFDLPYDTLLRFTPTETRQLDQFWSVKNDKEILFTRRASGATNLPQYVDERGTPWQRDDTSGVMKAIIIEDRGAKVRLEPKLTKDGKFPPGGEQFPGYYEVKGRRAMTQLGKVQVFRWGLFLANLTLNLLNAVLWFVCFWLILRFQWPHALFLAGLFWLASLVWIVPLVLEKTATVAREPRAAAISSDLFTFRVPHARGAYATPLARALRRPSRSGRLRDPLARALRRPSRSGRLRDPARQSA